jgi:hypothetical protein
MLAQTGYASNSGDFEAIDIEIRAKHLVVENAANPRIDPQARADAEQLLARALSLQERAESDALHVSPIRLRSLENAIESLRERVASSDAQESSITSGPTALVQGHVYPAPNTAGSKVQAKDFSGKTTVASATVAADGSYSLSVPAPGTYTLTALGGTSSGFLEQQLGGSNCEGTFSVPRYYTGNLLLVASNGTISEVTPSGSVASGFDFTLEVGGSISGTVMSGGNPVVGISVYADFGSGSGMACGSPGTTDNTGHFVIMGLPTESLVVYVDGTSVAPALQDTTYPNVPCGETDCSYGPQTYVMSTKGVDTPLANPIDVSATPSTLSGTVLDAGTNNPISGAAITLISEDSWTYDSGFITTDASGAYLAPQVRPANYRIVASAPGYVGGVYLSSSVTMPCVDPKQCDPIGIGGTIAVGNGVALTNYNLKLSRGASVSGTVTRASDHSAVAGATVTFANSLATVVSSVTDAGGNYTATGLPDGSYTAYASIPTSSPSLALAPTGLNGGACEGDANPSTCLSSQVNVSSSTPLTGINAAMAAGGTVTGLITDGVSEAPNPYAGQGSSRIELLDASGNQAFVIEQTSAAGFAAYGVAPGIYTPIFTTSTYAGWIDIAADGTPCPRRSCNLTGLPTITVSAATPVVVNIALPRGALLTGKVTDAATARPILQPAFDPTFTGLVIVIANPPYGGGFGVIDGIGVYGTRQGFAPGTYYSSTVWELPGSPVGFSPLGAGYTDQAYDGVVCLYMTCNLTGATSIPVSSGFVKGINYSLSKGGTITGTVTNLSTAPLNGVVMNAFNSSGQLVAQAPTNALGAYSLRGLPNGNYYVATTNSLGYSDQVYSGVACAPTCNPMSGTQINVTAPSTTTAVDFVLVDRIFSDGFE